MTADVGEFIENFLAHRSDYDPEKAREYYLRTRKLKGRKPAKAEPAALPKTQAGYPGQPHKLGTFMEEDMSPYASPGGGKLTSYSGDGKGKAVYSDGHVYDGNLGWIKPQPGHQRVNAAQARLDKARRAAAGLPPAKKKLFDRRIKAAQDKLNAIKGSTKSRANQ